MVVLQLFHCGCSKAAVLLWLFFCSWSSASVLLQLIYCSCSSAVAHLQLFFCSWSPAVVLLQLLFFQLSFCGNFYVSRPHSWFFCSCSSVTVLLQLSFSPCSSVAVLVFCVVPDLIVYSLHVCFCPKKIPIPLNFHLSKSSYQFIDHITWRKKHTMLHLRLVRKH